MKENTINKIVKGYMIVSVIYSFVGRVIPMKQSISENLNSWVYIILAGIGAILLIVDFFTTRKWYKGKYIVVLYIFIFVMGVSSLVNLKYGIVDNIKTIVWTIIQVGLIYTFYTRYSKDELILFFDKLWTGMSIFWFFPVVYSLYQFVVCDGYITKVGERKLRQGFYDNRLFGVFNDPNYAAIFSLCIVIAMVYLLKKTVDKRMRIFFKINIVVQYLYIVLSGSRTALVCMTVITGSYAFIWCYQKARGKYNWKKLLKIIFIPVVSMGLIVTVFSVVQKVSVIFPMTYYYFVDGEKDTHIKISDKDEIDVTLTERRDGKQGNISNNRTEIWKAYLKGMKGDLLLGGSPRNVLTKWQEKNSKGYLAQTGYETHNGYIYVLVGTGIIGMAVLGIYIILYARKIVIFIKGNYQIPSESLFVLAFLMVILIDVCFFTELFFIQSLISVLFWLHCGYAMLWLDALENKEQSGLKTD